ncbi:phage gp6-like head-tail connector protein [Clostridium tetani]|uniref:head-tail adaptor Ad1 n=1 Tax=Clostridium phage phiCT19406C TaxID=1567011 RepID=UPI000512F555|nr:head-tail connector protein [Clostridium tetani]YP_009218068.1 head-tail adaptor Ad1 [Clostridium phage phiCT19406C]AJA42862.1 head-tail connector [Clostridium phage phiCT19406C]KGI44660.1 DNA packaging protein [Clostridium tetani]KHO30855.1 DNA packaging protein [Clostridium tetani]RXI57493.1 phage gp6-like head-tail connector protein [Clostridium tetani]RXI62335.1 phage gp6-like head-tail connector protein [Clostridium tetani]
MILTLEETKEFLKVDYSDEDNYIQDLINASELYLKNSTGKSYDNTNPLAKLFCKVLVSDWYDNRGFMEENKVTTKVRYTIQSIIVQLSYCGGV